MIDFGDQIDAPSRSSTRFPDVVGRLPRAVPGGAARRVPGHQRRAGRADARGVRRRHPGHRGRRPRPEHLRVARRVPLQPAPVPDEFPRADGTPAARLPLYTNFRSGARILGGRRHGDRAACPRRSARPDKRLGRGRRNGEGEVRIAPRASTNGPRPTRSPTGASSCTTTGRVGRDRGAVPHEPAVRPAAAGVRRAGRAGRDRRARGAAEGARGGRGAGVRPGGAGPDGERGARPDPAGPAVPRRVQGPRVGVPARVGRDRATARGLRHGGRRRRGRAGAVRRGARAPRRGRGPLRRGPRAAGRVPRGAARAARRGAAAGRRVPGRGDPADRDPRRARRRPRPASRPRRTPQPRRVPRRGPRVRAGRGRAHAPRVPRLRGRGRAPRQAGVGAGAADRRRLGQGDDDPRREGPRVRPRVRARHSPTGCCRTPRSSRTRPSAASRSTSSCAATPRSCRASTAT